MVAIRFAKNVCTVSAKTTKYRKLNCVTTFNISIMPWEMLFVFKVEEKIYLKSVIYFWSSLWCLSFQVSLLIIY